MLKGCVQLAARSRIVSTVNAVPVNHMARLVIASALNPISDGVHVIHIIHVVACPRLRTNEYLSIAEYYGYKAPEVSYDAWKLELENFVSPGALEEDQEQHALMPLFRLCVNDLPADTRALGLDDRNAAAVLKADAENWTGLDESFGRGITRDDIGQFLGYRVKVRFIGPPSEKERPLPEILVAAQAVGGCGAA